MSKMPEHPLVYLHGEWRQCSVKTGHPTCYAVKDWTTGYTAYIPKLTFERALKAQQKRRYALPMAA